MGRTSEHQEHIDSRVSHSQCAECNADRERRFVDTAVWRYAHVSDYLRYVRPRIAAIHAGETSVDSRIWKRQFYTALNRRISAKVPRQLGRKHCDSYLERMGGMRHVHNPQTLRDFSQRGASAL